MKRVFFLIPALTGGGAERVFLNILTNIDRKKFKPKLILFEKKGALLSHLSYDIEIEALKKGKNIYGLQWTVFLRLIKLLRRERPDVVLSFMWYPNLVALIAKLFSRVECKIIVSERYSLSVSYESRFVEFLRRFAIRFFYQNADKIVVNSKDMGDELQRMYSVPEGKIRLIYNPIDIRHVNNASKEKIIHYWYKEDIPIIISIGRLTPQKGFSCLIKAFQLVISNGVPCRLLILGSGVEEDILKRLKKELHLDDKVDFPGFQKNPYKYLARSTVFVLSSLYEGFPNVLLEALALGVPSVATRCPTGPEEIITDGVNGLLVPPADERAIAEALKRLLMDESLKKRLGEAGKKRVEEFNVENIVMEYENVIEDVCAVSAVR